MNKRIEQFARDYLKTNLVDLNEDQVLLFKKMYSHNNLEKDINEVIDEMPIGTLDWAMQQVENTVAPEIETPSGDLQEQQLWDIKKLLKRETIEAYNHANRLMSKKAMPSEVLRVYNTEILEIIESLKI